MVLPHWGVSRSTAGRLISYGVPLVFLVAINYLVERSGGKVVRDLDVVELFAGLGRLAAACEASGELAGAQR